MFVSIIIPIKDELAIQELIDEIDDVIKQNHEIIIIDKSEVLPKVEGAKVFAQKSSGLGNAFVEGLAHANGDLIALMDGDGSHRPEDLAKILDEMGSYDIAIGSKLIMGGGSNDTIGRRMVTLAFAWLTRFILWISVKDPMTGFMVVKREVFNRITLKPRGFKIVIETIYKSRAKVKEVPIFFRERKAGTSKAGFNMRGIKEMLRIIRLLLELKLGRIRGKW